MTGGILLAAAAGGIFYLDRTAAFQTMIHRPLVVSTVIGWIFGNAAAGAQAGAVLELLYVARLPVGASLPPDDTGAAVFAGAASATAATSLGLDFSCLAAILVLSVVAAELGTRIDAGVRRLNGRVARAAAMAVDRGDALAVENGLFAGVALFVGSGVLCGALFAMLGIAAAFHILPLLGLHGRMLFAAFFPLLPMLGAASVFSCSRTERTAPAFYLTMFVAAAASAWLGGV